MAPNEGKKYDGSIPCTIMKKLIGTNIRSDLIKAVLEIFFKLDGPLSNDFACLQLAEEVIRPQN